MSDEVIQNKILASLATKDSLDSLELAKELELTHEKVYSLFLGMAALNLISIENKSENKNDFTTEGRIYLEHGAPEYKFGQFVAEHTDKNLKDLTNMFAEALPSLYPVSLPTDADKIAKAVLGKAKALGYFKADKSGISAGDLSTDKTQATLKSFAEGGNVPAKEINDLKKRGILTAVTINWFVITKGPKFVDNMSKVVKPVVELTEEMIKTGSWETTEFAPLNFEALGQKIPCGHEHPLLKVRSEFRNIFFQMGFEEMDTTKWVESSFWNFDTLFQGQQHPCRDMQDTFFLKSPVYANPIEDKAYFERVKEMHEKGGNGSIGLRYDFDEQVPLTNIMRTHTTAVSSRTLKAIADHYKKTGEIEPHRFFSIDRVYRNETLDATHLAEFHQVEGFVLGKNLSLGDLMNYVHEFFSRIGLDEIEFKPAYNPYTEPSMEIFAKHEGLGKWIEVGNSGVFRPEMISPMGFPEGWNVVAWGFSLERPTMIEYKIDEIRALEGPNVSLNLIENVPICRLTF